ncbi:MAG: hypothetical protein AAGI44_02360 [Pseudomonadota bacterium]
MMKGRGSTTRKNRAKHGEFDLTEVWTTLIEAVDCFRAPHHYKHPAANIDGCVVAHHPSKRHIRLFAFVDRHGREVKMEIDLKYMFADPRRYFDLLMRHLDQTMRDANTTGRIYVPMDNVITPAPNAIQNGIRSALIQHGSVAANEGR